ncbi:hypothetical protein [Krasilnikovia sp. MM14-A1259]|uniref:hypothetical protein n=1 Tax=Krasilnikovia sp. MM14-A1259 TaxID=3373539 RepID=UPI0038293E2D
MTQPNHLDVEAAEADAAEQAAIADPSWEEVAEPRVLEDLEAPEWDAQEQAQEVPFDDDYR